MKYFLIFLSLLLTFQTSTISAQTTVEEFINRHREFVRQSKFDEAINELSKAIAIDPGNVMLYLHRANVFLLKGDANGVVSSVDQAISLDPPDVNDWIYGVVKLIKVQKCSDALRILDRYVDKKAKNAEIYSWRSTAKRCLQDDIGAFEELAKAIEIDPGNDLFRANQASMVSRMGDYKKAVELFNILITSLQKRISATDDINDKTKLGRELAMTFLTRSDMHEKNNDTAEMFADLDRAVEAFPTLGTSSKGYMLDIRARKYSRYKMYDKAIVDLTESIKLGPSFSNYFARGNIYLYYLEKYDNAIGDFEESLKFSIGSKALIEDKINQAKKKRQETVNQLK